MENAEFILGNYMGNSHAWVKIDSGYVDYVRGYVYGKIGLYVGNNEKELAKNGYYLAPVWDTAPTAGAE